MNTNTKPFDPTKPCQTRGGDPVKILTTDALGAFPIFYQNERTKAVVATFANGCTWTGISPNDLINIPYKLVGWVNIYKDFDIPGFALALYESEAKARSLSNEPNYIETRKIEVEVQ